jgi:DNA-binding transcriptional MerR regulator
LARFIFLIFDENNEGMSIKEIKEFVSVNLQELYQNSNKIGSVKMNITELCMNQQKEIELLRKQKNKWRDLADGYLERLTNKD